MTPIPTTVMVSALLLFLAPSFTFSDCVCGLLSGGGCCSGGGCGTTCGGTQYAASGCRNCLNCPAGSYCGGNGCGTFSTLCPAGTANPNTGQYCGSSACGACAAGRFSSSGATTCTTCNPGTYSGAGASTCPNCPAGTFGSASGLTTSSCSGQCSAGFFCVAGSQSATQSPCNCGYFGASPGLSSPTCSGQCAPGRYGLGTSTRTSSSCDGPCSEGYYCPAGSCSSTQTPCPGGTYGNIAGLTNAACSGTCPAGFSCPAGTVNPVPCILGSYCPGAVQAPIPCPAGSYQSQGGQSVCVPCKPGYYGATTGLTMDTCSGPCNNGADCSSYSSSVGAGPLKFFLGAVAPFGSPSPATTRSTSISPTSSVATTASSTASPSGCTTASSTACATSTVTLSVCASTTPSNSFSPSPSVSPSASPSGCFSGSGTFCATATLSTSGCTSSSLSPSLSPSLSISPSAHPSASTWESFSPTPTLSATQTPTATRTPPPFSCLSRVGGCITPSPSIGPPVTVGGVPVSPTPPPFYERYPPTALVSWPSVSTPLSITFTIPPTLGEATNVTCMGDGATSLVVANSGQPLCTDPTSKTFPGCVSIPSFNYNGTNATLSGAAPIVAYFSILPFPSTPTYPPKVIPGVVSCVVNSAPLAFTIYSSLPLPRYGVISALDIPLAQYPLSYPLLAGIAMEGIGAGTGSFRGLADPASSFIQLPLFFSLAGACPAVFSLSSATNYAVTSVWRDATVVNCSAAVEALRGLAGGIGAVPGGGGGGAAFAGGEFAATISGQRHLLLFTHPLTPLTPTLNVSLGGVPCTINWVLPPDPTLPPGVFSSAIVSVSTPTSSVLCNASLGARGEEGVRDGDCGSFPLLVSHYTPPVFTNFTAPGVRGGVHSPYELTQLLTLPAAYPPLSPTPAWEAAIGVAQGAYTAMVGGRVSGGPLALPPPWAAVSGYLGVIPHPSPTLRYYDAVYTPPSGFQVATVCSDPTLAPTDLCGVVGYSQPLLDRRNNGSSSAALVCPWGGADVCQACPSPGFLCPGGRQLLPLPGFWAPSVNALPITAVPCQDPDSTLRCPGYTSVSSRGGVYGCGVGYRGAACAACDSRFFPSAGSCAPCPTSNLLLTLLVPLLSFFGGLLAFGVALFAALWVYLRERGRVSRPGHFFLLSDLATQVGQLLVWFWLAAQSLASIFSRAQSSAPPFIAPFFRAVGALVFQGIAIDPACYDSPPFLAFWLCSGVGLGAYLVIGGSLLAMKYGGGGGGGDGGLESVAWGVPNLFVKGCVLGLALGYGAITSVLSSAVVCTPAAPMSISGYLTAASDGRALRAALGEASPPLGDLRAALQDPQFAAASGLSTLLRTNIPVSTLAADPFQVCGEASHSVVRPFAIGMVVVFTLGFPTIGLVGLLWVGRLKGLRRGASRVVERVVKKRAPAENSSGGGGGGVLTSVAPSPLLGGITPWERAQAAKPPLPPVTPILLTSLLDPELVRPMQWTTFFEMWALAAITGCLAASQGRLPTRLYLITQGGVVLVCLATIAVLKWARRGGLYREGKQWKQGGKVALYTVAACTALFDATLVGLGGRASSGVLRLVLALVPLCLALGVVVVLIGAWGRALPDNITWIKWGGGKGGSRGGGGGSKTTATRNPLGDGFNPMFERDRRVLEAAEEAQRTKRAEEEAERVRQALLLTTPWEREVMEEAGVGGEEEWFWYNPAGEESQWHLPKGCSTTCGWVWEGEEGGGLGGQWRHTPSGATRPLPPHACKERDERWLQAYLERQERRAGRKGRLVKSPALPAPPPLVDELAVEEEEEEEEVMEEGGEEKVGEVLVVEEAVRAAADRVDVTREEEGVGGVIINAAPPSAPPPKPSTRSTEGVFRLHRLWKFSKNGKGGGVQQKQAQQQQSRALGPMEHATLVLREGVAAAPGNSSRVGGAPQGAVIQPGRAPKAWLGPKHVGIVEGEGGRVGFVAIPRV